MAHTAFECLTLQEMLARLAKYSREGDLALVERAYAFAEKAHQGQVRRSGEPYFSHPVHVASILVELQLDAPSVAASLLHDTVDDVEEVTPEVIQSSSG